MARSVTVREFRRILEDGTEAEKDALYIRIASSSIDELATTLLHEPIGVSRDQRTALQVAVQCDNMRFVRLLLEKGANHKSRNKYGGTALMAAALHSTDMLYYLLHEFECVDIINIENEYGMTALKMAMTKAPAAAAVKLLLDHGADPTMHTSLHNKYSDDSTPLIAAAYNGAIESANLLLEYGANLHDTTRCRLNAMHCAAEYGHAPFVKWLLDNGGGHDMMVSQNRLRKTPLDVARYYQYERDAEASQRVIDLLL